MDCDGVPEDRDPTRHCSYSPVDMARRTGSPRPEGILQESGHEAIEAAGNAGKFITNVSTRQQEFCAGAESIRLWRIAIR